MSNFNLRRLLFTFVPAIAALALVGGLCSLNTGNASAQGAYTTPNGQPMLTSAVGTCAAGDSWCGYCSMNSGADLCQAFVPAHTSGTTTTGAQGNSNDQIVYGVDAGGGIALPIPTSVLALYGPGGTYGLPSVSVAGTSSGLIWCALADYGTGAWMSAGLLGMGGC